jgi:hypothetical protein
MLPCRVKNIKWLLLGSLLAVLTACGGNASSDNASNKVVGTWKIHGGETAKSLYAVARTSHAAAMVTSLTFYPDGRLSVIAEGTTGPARHALTWSGEGGSKIKVVSGPTVLEYTLNFSGDGRQLKFTEPSADAGVAVVNIPFDRVP